MAGIKSRTVIMYWTMNEELRESGMELHPTVPGTTACMLYLGSLKLVFYSRENCTATEETDEKRMVSEVSTFGFAVLKALSEEYFKSIVSYY